MSAPHSGNVPRNRLAATMADLAPGFFHRQEVQASNPFGGRHLYFSDIDNSLFLAHQRWAATAEVTSIADGTFIRTEPVDRLFDGNYESRVQIDPGEQLDVHVTFPNVSGERFPGGYAYGYFLVSFYASASTFDTTMRVYCTHTGQGVGWKNLDKRAVGSRPETPDVLRFDTQWYGPSDIHLTVKNTGVGNDREWVSLTQLELYNDRPAHHPKPVLTKYRDERLYKRTTWGPDDSTSNAYIDEDGTAEFGRLRSATGPTTARPSGGLTTGTQYFDTTIGRPIWWDGSKWINATGTAV